MIDNKLIEEIKLKDLYACALMNHHINKGMTKGLQEYTDKICDEWARTFIGLHYRELSDRQTQISIFRYFDSVGVKYGHTGKRFSEALYKQLLELLRSKNNEIQQ